MHGFAGDDGNAEFALEFGGVDLHAGGHRHIHHVEGDDDGPAEIEDLVDEVEVALEIRGVDDADDPVGLRRVEAPAEEHIAQYRFVGRARGERIRAGQIDDLDRTAVLRVGRADFLFDGDAGIVADFLAQAGQGVEEGCLAGVGIAHHRVDRGTFRGAVTPTRRRRDVRGELHSEELKD